MASFVVELPIRVRRADEVITDFHLQPATQTISIPVEADDEHEAAVLVSLMLAGEALTRELGRLAKHPAGVMINPNEKAD